MFDHMAYRRRCCVEGQGVRSDFHRFGYSTKRQLDICGARFVDPKHEIGNYITLEPFLPHLQRVTPRRNALDRIFARAPTRCGSRHACAEVDQSHLSLGNTTARRVSKDRKSTRLNSSHVKISYAVFCLKKKK